METEPDWESIEQNLADYPDLAAYEDKIRTKAGLQRLIRFACEKNWDAFAKELGEHPELVEHEPSIRHEATLKRLQKAVSEGDWDAAGVEFDKLSAAEKTAFSEEVFKKLHWLAGQQAHHSTGQTESESFFRAAIHYKQINPQDGIESALARPIVSLTEATMDCFRRASAAEAPPARNAELVLAMKGALILSALTKALDGHRDAVCKNERANERRSTVLRNTNPMLASPRCGARTRSGAPCRAPAVADKKRCRMHGGAKGSGAPRGNTNALKHGAYTREALARRTETRRLIREARKLLRDLK